jgi:hypothetical protein
MRMVRVLIAVVVLLLGLAVAAAWFLPRFLDWDQYRQTIAAVTSEGLGRPVRIDGPISLSLLPQLTLRARDVSLADTGDGASATVAELRLRVALGALLAGRVEPEDLVLQGGHMRLPWPLAGLTLHDTSPPAGLHARVEDSTLQIGGLLVRGIGGDLSVDPVTGALAVTGVATVMDRSWRMTGRLGQAGADGVATVEVSLDGQGAAVDTGGSLSGQIAPDGSLTGRIAGRGRDLSLLLAAPARPWRANGRVVASSGLLVADDLDLDIGGAPARGAVALRLLPHLRLDAALATSRLDLDAWLPPLLRGGSTALPTGIDLSAEAASLGGGVLRRLRVGFDLAPDGVTVREASALLPGDADLHVSGLIRGGRFTGDGRLVAPDLPQTLAWLRSRAPALADALPPDAVRTVMLSAAVTASGDSVALANVQGDADGAAVTGDMSLRMGDHPAVAANLQLNGLVLDPWLPNPPSPLLAKPDVAATARAIVALPRRFASVDTDVTVVANHPVWLGIPLDRLALEARTAGGTLDLRRFALTAPDVSVALSGQVSTAGRISDGKLDVALGHADLLRAQLPDRWRLAETLFRGPMSLQATLTGDPNALQISARTELADAELQAAGLLDAGGTHWKGSVTLRHPGAPRLLTALGYPDAVSWLGDGSLSLQTGLDLGADRVALSGLVASVGGMRMAADVTVTGLAAGHPVVAGTVDADMLPLPLPYARSPDPWPLDPLRDWQGRLALHAAHVLIGQSPALENATATANLAGGTFRLDDVAAGLAGGRLTGRLSVQAASPPRVALAASLTGAVIAGPLLDSTVDVSSGRLDATVDLSAMGYSPAGVLATLTGQVHTTIHDGTLAGLDEAAVAAALANPILPGPNAAGLQTQIGTALQGGTTPFRQLDLALAAANGVVSATQGTIDTVAGTIAMSGNLNLPALSLDAHLAIQPGGPDRPVIGLRLIGPAAHPDRTTELAPLAQWLASH